MTLTTAARAKSLVTLSTAGAPPVAYVSPFRRTLARGQWAALAALIVWALSCFWALRSADVATRVIGHDTAPSIAAAERIRSLLSDADRNLANMTMVDDPETGPYTFAYRGDIADAEALLVEAAQNITYGDAEKTPIVAIARGVAEYERLVGRARMAGSGPKAVIADTLMRSTILPATEALDKANYDQLSFQYEIFLQSKPWLFGLVALTSLAGLAVLVWLQVQIRQYARRLVNLGLAAATIILVGVSLYVGFAFVSASGELKTAKSDAFDSIYALTTLLADANNAGAADGFWLTNSDDNPAREKYDELYKSLAKQVVGVDPENAISDAARGMRFPGLLGDELANITFVGEDTAALSALNAWADYVAIEKKMRDLAAAYRSEDAAALAGGDKPGQLNWAFTVFQRTVELTIRINQNAFDAAIAASEATINSVSYGVLFAAWLVASGLAWFGIRQRLRDYEF
jgi:hypothetical protein